MGMENDLHNLTVIHTLNGASKHHANDVIKFSTLGLDHLVVCHK